MIVKNESRVIARCLDSVLPLVDAYVIVDTGSTDDTKELISAAGKRHDVRGIVPTDEWKNFGHNRTRASGLTREYAKQRGFALSTTYMLLVDADMVLRSAGFDRKELVLPMYYLEQRAPGLAWANTRLCRLDHEWISVGVTHEFWRAVPDVPLVPPPKPLSTLWLDDIGDGGAKGDKSERDIRLLERGLLEEPGNIRYMFYLAQTFWDVGRYEDAISFYRRRLDCGGWEEECWYSLYRIGLCELRLGREDAGIRTLMRAFERRPTRVEPLIALAQHLRAASQSNLALLFARAALRLPLSNDGLFVETLAYTRAAREEIAISAYYTADKPDGRLACESLLSERTDFTFRNHILQCASFYAKPIAQAALSSGSFLVSPELRKKPGLFLGLSEPNGTEYLPKNPTIVRYRGSFLVHVSLVNYHHDKGIVFAPKDPDGIVRTRGAVLAWDPETHQATQEHEPEWEMPPEWAAPSASIRGLEDQRWCVHGGRIWFTSTCFHVNGNAQVVLGLMDKAGRNIERLLSLKYDRAFAVEKNWLPFSFGDRLCLVYSFAPLVVLEVDTDTGHAKELVRGSADDEPHGASTWRGGTPPVRVGEKLVTLIHEVAHFHDRRVYMHRLVELGQNSSCIWRASDLFCFEHTGVEYATGLIQDTPGTVIVTFGSEEREAKWMRFDIDIVRRLLEKNFP
jgi:glycosyltransferase involved in cell wall biosynthesis